MAAAMKGWRVGAAALVLAATGAAQAELAWGAASGNRLLTFDTSTPGLIASDIPVTGLGAGELLRGLDVRPATGELYGLTTGSAIYKINPVTGAATAVTGGPSFTLSGTQFGFDFNPTVDRIRIVSDTGQNLRINPNDGGLAGTDSAINYAVGDVNFGATPSANGAAYTNNVNPPPGSTTLYVIETNQNVLAIQNPPNSGTLNTVGPLGFDATDLNGFDISGLTGTAFAVMTTPGGNSALYTINLATGAASLVGAIGDGSESLRGFTVNVPEPATLALLVLGGLLIRRR